MNKKGNKVPSIDLGNIQKYQDDFEQIADVGKESETEEESKEEGSEQSGHRRVQSQVNSGMKEKPTVTPIKVNKSILGSSANPKSESQPSDSGGNFSSLTKF